LSQSNDEERDADVSDEPPPEEDDHHHDEPWNENIFKTDGEMPNHTPEAVIVELATMRKKILKKGKGNNCLPDDFAKIHYRGYIAKTGKIVEDTYTKLKGGPNAKLFIVGHFDKIKCFDLILPQMK
jgi:hypothetical protein